MSKIPPQTLESFVGLVEALAEFGEREHEFSGWVGNRGATHYGKPRGL
jgi:hypothetical protein